MIYATIWKLWLLTSDETPFTVSRFFLHFSIWFYFSIGSNQWDTADARGKGGGGHYAASRL